MTNYLSMSAGRACSRCGKELTDAASMEAGVGPICRKLDNALLAKIIPANPGLAKKLWGTISVLLAPPDTVHTLTMVADKVATMPDVDDDCFGGDWRETVKRIEWVLSHKLPDMMKTALYGFVEALGYSGLVAMWLGEAASGVTQIFFIAGRLVMAGPRNKPGQVAMKAIPGRQFRAKTASLPAAWSVPASQAAAFELVVKKHWPNYQGLTAALAEAAAFLALPELVSVPKPVTTEALQSVQTGVAAPMTVEEIYQELKELEPVVASITKSATKPEPKYWITVDGDNLSVRTPYNWNFVQQLKSLFYKDRAWNKVAACWVVKKTHLAFVEALCEQFFGEPKAAQAAA